MVVEIFEQNMKKLDHKSSAMLLDLNDVMTKKLSNNEKKEFFDKLYQGLPALLERCKKNKQTFENLQNEQKLKLKKLKIKQKLELKNLKEKQQIVIQELFIQQNNAFLVYASLKIKQELELKEFKEKQQIVIRKLIAQQNLDLKNLKEVQSKKDME